MDKNSTIDDKDIDKDLENEPKRIKDRSPSPGIKSTAVVKYTAVQSPVGYARLQCNTDLNLPPSNWSSAINSYGLKQILTQSSGLSSFRMAHMFPDSVGEVDVISGAECIKKLLKLPYQPTGSISMMVHRVENTILLDDYNVYDCLMKSQWPWLKDFYYENILKTMSEQEHMKISLKSQGSPGWQLTSKFLCHSIASLPEPEKEVKKELQPSCSRVDLDGPFLPESESRSEEEIPSKEHSYNRNVLWTFENIQMLIGSDLPIFGGKDRPCVSLRLRDAREPINVLTGIDYWLDNLMCNVPEVLMCYHIDGIVQKYEPMKTEDIPNLEGSKFSPKVVRNVAQNILSFLKSNATKSGHTYWLFKGPRDDVVKLYDLTSLCGGLGGTEGMDNPFTTPVAMLLYRVARNMRMTNRTKHVKVLLENAIKLLSEERYPQIVASSRYMLADLYLPATTNPAEPNFKDESSEDSDDEDEAPLAGSGGGGGVEKAQAGATGSQLAVQMRGLALHDIGEAIQPSYQSEKSKHDKGRALGTEPLDRCSHALEHALKGLQALHHVTIDKCKLEERERLKQQIIIEEQHPKMANPYEPITMNYEPLDHKTKQVKQDQKERAPRGRRRKRERKSSEKTSNCLIEKQSNIDKNAILVRKENNVYPTIHEPNRDDNFAWKLHLKTLLYEKICLAYATLAEYSYMREHYGFSLKYIEIAGKCQKLLSNIIIKSRVVDASCLIGRVGDNYFQIAKHWHKLEMFRRQFETDHKVDELLKSELESDMNEEIEEMETIDEFDLDIKLPENETAAMIASCEYYKKALAVTVNEKRTELLRRLASVKNELGVRYMNEGEQILVQYAPDGENKNTSKAKELESQFQALSKKSWDQLSEAMDIFERVNDVPNLALLYCNKGRFMRFKAHGESTGFNTERKSMYKKAEEMYRTALKLLGPKETCGAASIRELVCWELSSHTYYKATMMQEHPLGYFTEANEVADALKHALKCCLLSPGPRQYLYQFRAGMIYHRLGSLYHKQYRETTEEGPKRRTVLNLTRTNYEQAMNIFASLEEADMYLKVLMAHVSIMEAQADNSPNLKLKSLQMAFQLLRQSHSVIKLIKNQEPDDQKEKRPDDEDAPLTSVHSLLGLYENRLHFVLRSMIQHCRSKSNKDYDRMSQTYKKMYSASLTISKSEDVRCYAKSICDVLEAIDRADNDS